MPFSRDFWLRLKQVMGSILAFNLFVYVVYHLIQGDRGLYALYMLRQDVQTIEKTRYDLDEENQVLARRVDLLRDQALDIDLLEEQAYKSSHAHPNDVVIYVEESPKKSS